MTGYARYLAGVTVVLAAALVFVLATAPQAPGPDRDLLFQVSTIDALLIGDYEGSVTFSDLRSYGDFGLGTFDALDGEMVAFEGTFWQVLADGTVTAVPGTMTTPFSVVTWFDPDQTFSLDGPVNLTGIEAAVDAHVTSPNYFFAVLVDGTFDSVTVRSVPRQEEPYPPLADAVLNQSVYTYTSVEGALVGFWSPAYISGINVPGYHLHFISDDRTMGGHVLGCTLRSGDVALDTTPRFTMVLPDTISFSSADLTGDRTDELATVEKK
jgi:acetolactate decarboxylase